MFSRLKGMVATVVTIACLVVAGGARAESILSSGLTVTPSGPNFEWKYAITVSGDAAIKTGDFFVIIDFNGLVAGTNFEPAGWTFSTEAVSSPVVSDTGMATAPDSATLNLKWTYTAAATIPGPASLGDFGADSIYNIPILSALLGRDHSTVPGVTFDRTEANNQPIAVPAAPLPSVAGVGLALLGGLGLARRRS
jgi:hypothetical protein